MKVNMNQSPDNDKGTGQSTNGNNVYADALNGYKEKLMEQVLSGAILRTNKFWVFTLVVLFVIFLSVNSNVSNDKAKLTGQLKKTEAQIADLEGAVAEVKQQLDDAAKIKDVNLSEEQKELARNDAKVAGSKVADLQNKYLSIDSHYLPKISATKDEAEIRTQNDFMRREIETVKNELDQLFTENGKKNGKGKWYNYNVNGIAGKWEFATNATFKGTTSKVLWLCYANDPDHPDDHSLLAYATSNYNAETKTFDDVDIQLTKYAESNIDSVIHDDGTSSLMDQLQGLIDSGQVRDNTPPADQPYDQNISEGRDDYKNSVANGDVQGEEYDPNYNVGLPNGGDSE